jgi:hypothetical protein
MALVVSAILLAPLPRAAVAVPTAGDSGSLQCPERLVQRPVAEALPPGWVAHAEAGGLPLERVGFYDGDPVGLGALAPDATHRDGLIETSTWSFEPGRSARVWLGCLYRGASAILARPLPSGLSRCTTVLRLTRLGDPSEAVSVQCR